ncbi:indole-2-monooxygenase-like [Phragmites australis]|uniref:indole-2-monooxygenase-like n=1 Tax=Phragmites australis TaxID=29695 RepID=UPI002D776BCA|nr:indole-2-monooxygenase-like [Phragmites australis]
MAQVSLLHSWLSHGAASVTPQALAFIFFFPLVMLLVTARLLRPSKQLETLSRIPSPPRLPVIGHLHLVGSLPHVSLRDLARRHGPDLMLLHLGAAPKVIVSSPRAAEAVLRTHDHVFASRPFNPLADILFYGLLDVGFAPYGERWRQAKKLLTMHLLTARKVRSFRGAREAEVRHAVAKIRGAAAAGDALDLSALLKAYTNDVMCRAVSGRFFFEDGRNRQIPELTDVVKDVFGAFKPQDYFPALARVDVLSRSSLVNATALRNRWDKLFDALIDFHVHRLPRHQDDDGGQEEEAESDFIDVMLSLREEYGLTRNHIKAILMNMFNAGTDTTYLVHEFAMAELMRHPHAMAKLQTELRSKVTKGDAEILTEDDDLSSMTYLKAVIKETLRLHPPGPLFLPHLNTADCEIEGYMIPAGTTIMINAWSIGRDPRFWEDPEEFMPERFLDGGRAAGVDYKGQDFNYIPFGSGRRICPGLSFGIASLEIMLANLLYHFDWEVPGPGGSVDMTEKFGVTVHRKSKLVLLPKHKLA